MAPIPEFVDQYHLPDGEHECTFEEIEGRFLGTTQRRKVWELFKSLLARLETLGLKPEVILINGSFTADRQTRTLLTTRAKGLKHDTEYVEASAVIRAQDIDQPKLVARPLKVGRLEINEIECKLSQETPIDNIPNYLNKIITRLAPRPTWIKPRHIHKRNHFRTNTPA